MALNYSISMRSSNPMDPEAIKKAYAKAQIGSNVSLKTMSKRIASQTTVNRADVMAVLTALVDNIFEVLREGNQVDLGELGKLRLQISSEGAAKAEEFTSDYIKDVNIQFVPGEDLKITEFTRLPGAQGQEGFGLGLSITRKLVELQNGEINVESTPGQGSCFSVTIPLPSYIHEKPVDAGEKLSYSMLPSLQGPWLNFESYFKEENHG